MMKPDKISNDKREFVPFEYIEIKGIITNKNNEPHLLKSEAEININIPRGERVQHIEKLFSTLLKKWLDRAEKINDSGEKQHGIRQGFNIES